ncbi:MAG: hypothetical protein ACKVU0_17530 [Saprospiraceae bacterium]
MKTCVALFLLLSFPLGEMRGQGLIKLENPSFESDEPSPSKVPRGWINLGATDQTPPDIQPGFFGVDLPAQDGNSYLGLVVRENNTWEGIGQKLEGVLQKDSAYSFNLFLSRSNTLQSPLNENSELKKFNNPTVLKIWGYNTKTKEEELLAESQPVSHSKWMRYEFVLKPTLADFDELDLMAYYAPGAENKNGNLLIDNCSTIEKIEK